MEQERYCLTTRSNPEFFYLILNRPKQQIISQQLRFLFVEGAELVAESVTLHII